MDVQTAQTRQIEHRLRQDQPVSSDDHRVGVQGSQLCNHRIILERDRLRDRQPF